MSGGIECIATDASLFVPTWYCANVELPDLIIRLIPNKPNALTGVG